uniref:SSD domain-containing protein n=1 Tax=Macrostomum lignano TaxID=282301 RepID=A0A1I8FNJ8_9PLAT
MVKSKWGLAFGACFTVVASLLNVRGVLHVFWQSRKSERFGNLSLSGCTDRHGECLVITKSVVSTPVELEVRHRVAVGLSKEGWTITPEPGCGGRPAGLGLLSSTPASKKFALFAVVGLCTDFFLQMFFVTILAIDYQCELEPLPVPQDLAVTLGLRRVYRRPITVIRTGDCLRLHRISAEQLRKLLNSIICIGGQPYDANTAAFLMHSLTATANFGSSLGVCGLRTAVPRRIRVLYTTWLANGWLCDCCLVLCVSAAAGQRGLISAVSRQHAQLSDISLQICPRPSSSNPGSPGDLVEHPDYQRYWPEMAAAAIGPTAASARHLGLGGAASACLASLFVFDFYLCADALLSALWPRLAVRWILGFYGYRLRLTAHWFDCFSTLIELNAVSLPARRLCVALDADLAEIYLLATAAVQDPAAQLSNNGSCWCRGGRGGCCGCCCCWGGFVLHGGVGARGACAWIWPPILAGSEPADDRSSSGFRAEAAGVAAPTGAVGCRCQVGTPSAAWPTASCSFCVCALAPGDCSAAANNSSSNRSNTLQPCLCTWSPPCLLPSNDAIVTSSSSGLNGLDVWCLARRRRLS